MVKKQKMENELPAGEEAVEPAIVDTGEPLPRGVQDQLNALEARVDDHGELLRGIQGQLNEMMSAMRAADEERRVDRQEIRAIINRLDAKDQRALADRDAAEAAIEAGARLWEQGDYCAWLVHSMRRHKGGGGSFRAYVVLPSSRLKTE